MFGVFAWVLARARLRGDKVRPRRGVVRARRRRVAPRRGSFRRSQIGLAGRGDDRERAQVVRAHQHVQRACRASREGFGRARDRPRGRGGIVSGRPRPSTGRGRSVFGSVTTFRGICGRKGFRVGRSGETRSGRVPMSRPNKMTPPVSVSLSAKLPAMPAVVRSRGGIVWATNDRSPKEKRSTQKSDVA